MLNICKSVDKPHACKISNSHIQNFFHKRHTRKSRQRFLITLWYFFQSISYQNHQRQCYSTFAVFLIQYIKSFFYNILITPKGFYILLRHLTSHSFVQVYDQVYRHSIENTCWQQFHQRYVTSCFSNKRWQDWQLVDIMKYQKYIHI